MMKVRSYSVAKWYNKRITMHQENNGTKDYGVLVHIQTTNRPHTGAMT